MADDDIQLDETPAPIAPPTPAKPKSATPVWMVILVVLAFGCLVRTLTLQYLEFSYLRGGAASETDPYAAPALIPPAT